MIYYLAKMSALS